MTQQTEQAIVRVDGDKLAEALRRVAPFMAESNPPNLACVYVESRSGVLEFTACDGHRMGHLTIALPFLEGNWLMKARGVKDFSQRHYNGTEIEIKRQDALPDSPLVMGDVAVELETTPYIDYASVIPQEFDTEAIIETKSWIKPIRQYKPESIGIVYSATGCLMYLRSSSGETVSCEHLPVQMFNGPDKRVAYQAEKFRRALTSCGPGTTIEVGDPAKPTLFEMDDYWHILMPYGVFPNEVSISSTQRDAIKWAEEALEAIRKGDVPGLVLIGGGKFYLELNAARVMTDIRVEEPQLANAPEPSVEAQNTSEESGDDDGQ